MYLNVKFVVPSCWLLTNLKWKKEESNEIKGRSTLLLWTTKLLLSDWIELFGKVVALLHGVVHKWCSSISSAAFFYKISTSKVKFVMFRDVALIWSILSFEREFHEKNRHSQGLDFGGQNSFSLKNIYQFKIKSQKPIAA